MTSFLSSPLSPENEVLNFKQMEGENLKDAWYRIFNAQNKSTRKQSTLVLLRNFYVGANPWYRYILDTITGGNFLGSHTFDSYNALIDIFGSPPLLIKGTTLTLEHVMRRLEIIENKVAIIESIENLDKKIHNQITQYGSKVGMTLKNIKEKAVPKLVMIPSSLSILVESRFIFSLTMGSFSLIFFKVIPTLDPY